MKPRPNVLLVEDEPGMRKALSRLLDSAGFGVRGFASAEEFLAADLPAEPGCLLLDVAMPGIDGLELQQRLAKAGASWPIVFLTGQGDIPMSVRAIKAGATDFLTKPVEEAALLSAVRAALAQAIAQSHNAVETVRLRERLTQLTPRERQVLEQVIAGKLNKQIAAALGTGEHTIKVHRGRVMEKLGVQSVAELVRLSERLGVQPAR